MVAEHRRPGGGWGQGYYCLNCGASGMNMYGMPHLKQFKYYTCKSDSEMVAAVIEANKKKAPANP